MSAAEPADPTPPVVNTGGHGAVIDISARRRRGGAATPRGRWSTMATPSSPHPGPQTPGPQADRKAGQQAGQQALARWAEDIEKTFNTCGHSLTDDDTAAVFAVTLRIFARALEGSRATGIIDEKQLAELLGVIQGMEQAPRLLT